MDLPTSSSVNEPRLQVHWQGLALVYALFALQIIRFAVITRCKPRPVSDQSSDYFKYDNTTRPSTFLGAIFAALGGISFVMVSVIYWVRRQTRKAMEARESISLEFRKKGLGRQNTSYGLDTSFAVPTGISNPPFDISSTVPAPQSRLHNSFTSAPVEWRQYEPGHRQLSLLPSSLKNPR